MTWNKVSARFRRPFSVLTYRRIIANSREIAYSEKRKRPSYGPGTIVQFSPFSCLWLDFFFLGTLLRTGVHELHIYKCTKTFEEIPWTMRKMASVSSAGQSLYGLGPAGRSHGMLSVYVHVGWLKTIRCAWPIHHASCFHKSRTLHLTLSYILSTPARLPCPV